MSKSNKKTPIVFYVGIVLACLTLISVYMTSGLYARYTTRATSSDSARVAKFRVTNTLTVTDSKGDEVNSFTMIEDSLIPGESTTYAFEVQNDSEVAVRFSVRGEVSINNLPLVMSPVTITLAPNTSETAQFVVSWPANEDDPAYGDMIELIEIFVTAEQIN